MQAVSFVLLFAQLISCFKLASYNTYQFPSNPYASNLLMPQFTQIASSDIDTFCFQELNLLNTTFGYINQLKQSGYEYSFSIIDVLRQSDPQSLELPRTPCNQQQFAAVTSSCSVQLCGDLYSAGNTGGYAVCMATIQEQGLCSDGGWTEVMYSECVGCLAVSAGILAPILQRHPTIEESAGYCLTQAENLNFYFNITNGAYIVSKLPIIKTWSFILPSWLIFSTRVNIAQINICSETDAQNLSPDCADSIIVGCTHLEPTDFITDQNVVQSPLDASLDSISSHIGLNRAQTNYILDNIFNDNLLNTLGIAGEADQIYGAFLLGDTNSGQFFDRCDYPDENGEPSDGIPADDCTDINGEQIENVFNLFGSGDLIDAPDIEYQPRSYNPEPVCTQCIDPELDDYNPLIGSSSDTFIYDPDTQLDLDHILIQAGYCHNFDATSFGQIFTDRIVDLSEFGFAELTPTSDHYGVSIELTFRNTETGGGRKMEDSASESGSDSSESSAYNALFYGHEQSGLNDESAVSDIGQHIIVSLDSATVVNICGLVAVLFLFIGFCVWMKKEIN